ncbi:MAG TPA: NAD-dependent epimerase/dehydratase family protein [Pyrinomonadaceae bacterium]|jgi:nucleoside-diphosphate-sugar epimerase
MRILIIGGTRFVGPCVVRRLVGAGGHEVTIFHRGETETELSPDVRHIHGDHRDLLAFEAEFKQLAPQVVLDMIAYTEQDAANLLHVFKGLAERTVVLSSADVYRAYGRLLGLQSGPPDSIPLSEDAPLRDALYPYRAKAAGTDDPVYSYEKILVESVVMSDAHLPCTILRLPAVYGEGDFQHRLSEYLKRMDDGRPFIMLEEARAAWRWTRGYIDNVADAIALAVTDERATGRIYNVGERDTLTETEWVRAVGRAAGWKGEVIAVPGDMLPGGMAAGFNFEHHLAVDTSRMREELGYSEQVSRDEALKRAVGWERTHPPEKIDPQQFDYAAEDAVLERIQKRL